MSQDLLEAGLSALAGVGMGLTISALGAGGSLFIVPVLVYLLHEPVSTATGTSLAVVFAAAVVGAIGHWHQRRVRWKVAASFGGAAMLGAVGGAAVHDLVEDEMHLVLFACALCVAAGRMAIGHAPPAAAAPPAAGLLRVLPLGAATGVVTGFLGVGGGFLIVPALTWGARLGVREAIGTSLAVIAASSATGAASHALQGHASLPRVLIVGAGAVLGALAGARLSGKLPERPLRYSFATLALAVAVYMGIGAA